MRYLPKTLIFLVCIIFSSLQPTNRSLFAPRDDVGTKLIDLIRQARSSIDVAVYYLTLKPLAQALIDASARKVKVTVILDPISTDKFGKAEFLAQANVAVYIFDQSKVQKNFIFGNDDVLMHHKFAIFDNTLLWTGSFNWTKSASEKHRENVIITDDKTIVADYRKEFTQLLKLCKSLKVTNKVTRAQEQLQDPAIKVVHIQKNNVPYLPTQAGALQQ